MADVLANGLLLPVLSVPPTTPPAGTVALFVMAGQVRVIDAAGTVTALTNV